MKVEITFCRCLIGARKLIILDCYEFIQHSSQLQFLRTFSRLYELFGALLNVLSYLFTRFVGNFGMEGYNIFWQYEPIKLRSVNLFRCRCLSRLVSCWNSQSWDEFFVENGIFIYSALMVY